MTLPRTLVFVLQSPASELLLAFEGDEIVGSIMMGNDGHRGWVYYLGVLPAWRHCAATNGAGGAMDVCKGSSQDARHDHLEGRSFYTALGYADDDVLVVEKFLNGQSENLNPRCLF